MIQQIKAAEVKLKNGQPLSQSFEAGLDDAVEGKSHQEPKKKSEDRKEAELGKKDAESDKEGSEKNPGTALSKGSLKSDFEKLDE